MSPLALAQLVSQGQVEAARSRMIFWIGFTVVMFGVLVWKLVQATNRKACDQCGIQIPSARATCPRCGAARPR